MLIGISGNIRSGKTLIATILGYILIKFGDVVYSNYWTKFSILKSPLDLINFNIDKGDLILDEIHTMIDSRLNSQAGRYISYFITQSGKREINIIYTTQSFMMVDKRLRELTHIKILCHNYKTKFKYQIFKLQDDGINYKYIRSLYLSHEKAKLYFDLYDTKEIIFAPDVSSESTITLDEIKQILNDAPTKQAFKYSLRKANPYLSLDTSGAVYDYLIMDDEKGIKEAKKLLGLK